MGIFGRFFRVQRVSSKSVAAIPHVDKKQIEDKLENGWLIEEIADETGYLTEQISRVKDIWQRRKKEKRRDEAEEYASGDKLTQARRDLEAERVQLEIDKLKLEREKLEMQRAELNGENEEDSEPDDEERPRSMIEEAISGLVAGILAPKVPPPQRILPEYGVTAPLEAQGATIKVAPMPEHSDEPEHSSGPERRLTDEQIRALIKDTPKKYLKMVRTQLVSRDAAIAAALAKFPGATQADAERAWDIIQTET